MGDSVHFQFIIDFDVDVFENKSGLTEEELFEKVNAYVEEERKQLVMEARIAALALMNGESLEEES